MTKPFKMDLLLQHSSERIVPLMTVGGARKGKRAEEGMGFQRGTCQTWVLASRGGWKNGKMCHI